jgi:hypothetical protein
MELMATTVGMRPHRREVLAVPASSGTPGDITFYREGSHGSTLKDAGLQIPEA